MQRIKKVFMMVFFSSLVGFILGFITYKNYVKQIDMVFSLDNSSYAFQVGVYNTLESAEEEASNSNGIVVKDKDFYRVYIALATNEELKNEISAYYDKQGISYYIRNLELDKELKSKLSVYEAVLSSVGEEEYSLVINKMIKEYEKGVSV